MSKIKQDGFVGELADAISVLTLDKAVIERVAAKKESTKYGTIILVLPLIVSWILNALNYPSGFGALFSRFVYGQPLVPVVSFVLTIFVTSLTAEYLFKSKSNHEGFYRVMAYASIINWVAILPYIFALLGFEISIAPLIMFVAGIWSLIVAFNLLEQYHKLNTKETAICLVIGILANLILLNLLGTLFIGKFYSYY